MGRLKDYLMTQELYPAGWAEDMADMEGQALSDAEREFLSKRNDAIHEADDMPLWIQLELDLWEGQHGIGAFTAWDLADGGIRG